MEFIPLNPKRQGASDFPVKRPSPFYAYALRPSLQGYRNPEFGPCVHSSDCFTENGMLAPKDIGSAAVASIQLLSSTEPESPLLISRPEMHSHLSFPWSTCSPCADALPY